MAEQTGSLELLFEVQGSCKPVFVTSESLVCEVERELEELGMDGILAYFSCPRGQHLPHKNVYILQRWNERWGKFVDVTDITQVLDGDRLTVSPQPSPARFPLSTAGAHPSDSLGPCKYTDKKFDSECGQVCHHPLMNEFVLLHLDLSFSSCSTL